MTYTVPPGILGAWKVPCALPEWNQGHILPHVKIFWSDGLVYKDIIADCGFDMVKAANLFFFFANTDKVVDWSVQTHTHSVKY